MNTLNGIYDQRTTQDVRQEIIKTFQLMPLEQKQALAMATVTWEVIDFNWANLSPSERQQFQTQYQTQNGQVNNSYENNTNNQMTWDQYRALSNMSLQMHATNLNIIENIGGTGNYWEVR